MKVEFDHPIITYDLHLTDANATVQADVEHVDGGFVASLTTVLITLNGRTLDITNALHTGYREELQEQAISLYARCWYAVHPVRMAA